MDTLDGLDRILELLRDLLEFLLKFLHYLWEVVLTLWDNLDQYLLAPLSGGGSYYKGFCMGASLVIIVAFFFTLYSNVLKPVLGFFDAAKKDGPSPFSSLMSCLWNILFLLLFLGLLIVILELSDGG